MATLRQVSQNEVVLRHLETTRPKESNSEAHQDEQAASLEALPSELLAAVCSPKPPSSAQITAPPLFARDVGEWLGALSP